LWTQLFHSQLTTSMTPRPGRPIVSSRIERFQCLRLFERDLAQQGRRPLLPRGSVGNAFPSGPIGRSPGRSTATRRAGVGRYASSRSAGAMNFPSIGAGKAVMAHSTGESESDALRLDFDRRLMLQFRGSVVTSDAGLHRPGLMMISAQRVVGNFRTSGQFYTDFLYP
jgi:hypothetical protein